MLNGQERLILATQTFSLETVWMQGYAEGKNNNDEVCPYDNGSKESHYWNEGCDASIFGEQPLFPDYSIESDSINLIKPRQTPKNVMVKRALTIIGACIDTAFAIDLVA